MAEVPSFRIGGMSQLATPRKFVTKEPFAPRAGDFPWLAIDEEARTRGAARAVLAANAVRSSPTTNNSQSCAYRRPAAIRRRRHRGDDALGVTRAAAVDMPWRLRGGEERRDRVHVVERVDDGLAKGDEELSRSGRPERRSTREFVAPASDERCAKNSPPPPFMPWSESRSTSAPREANNPCVPDFIGKERRKGRKRRKCSGYGLSIRSIDFRMTVTWP